MKKTLIFTMLFMAFSIFITAQNADAEAIKKAIENESFQFHNNDDRNVFLSCWKMDDHTRMVYSGKEGVTYMTGKTMKAAAEAGQIPKADHAKTTFSNYHIRVSGDVAWAVFDQGDATGKVQTHEFRCMEKIGGVWLISSSSIHAVK